MSVRGRALPIVVACGLAMGVFGGLVVVRGVGQPRPVQVAPAAEAVGTPSVPVSTTPAPSGQGTREATPTLSGSASGASPSAAGSPGQPAGGTGSPGEPASGEPGASSTGRASDSPTASSAGAAVVSFEVRPRRSHIFINGTELDGTSTDVPLTGGTAVIEVVVKARGYKTYTETHTITGDHAIEVSLSRDRRSSGPGGLLDIR